MSTPALFHFSDDPAIRRFTPRPVQVAVERGPAKDWLNGPLVWATDAAHSLLYLFPRDCPRILIWPTLSTIPEDRDPWFAGTPHRAIAFIEQDWLERVQAASVHRYAMPAAGFEDIGDTGMWVSREPVDPTGMDSLGDLPAALAADRVALRVVPRLTPFKRFWRSTLHVSGLRLRHAQDWE